MLTLRLIAGIVSRWMGWTCLCLVVSGICVPFRSALATEFNHRVAFIVGINDYKNFDKLRNAVNDARLVKRTLIELGWSEADIVYAENMKVSEKDLLISSFANKLRKNESSVFVFLAGHGVEDIDSSRPDHYLLAADAVIRRPSMIRTNALALSALVDEANSVGADVKIFAIDTCRTRIDRRSIDSENTERSISAPVARGLGRSLEQNSNASISAPYFFYATATGEPTSDGPAGADNSLFTRTLVKHISNPEKEAILVLRDATRDYHKVSGIHVDGKGYIPEGFFFTTRPRRPLLSSDFSDFQNVAAPLVATGAYEGMRDGVTALHEVLKRASIDDVLSRAEQGDAEALYLAGVAYMTGIGVVRDPVKQLTYLQRASKRAFRRADFALGNMYYYGDAVPLDKAEGVRFWERSASVNFPPSEMALARHFAFDAQESNRQPARARMLFRKLSASADDPKDTLGKDALAQLALMTIRGIGESANLVEGVRKMRDAAAIGSPLAMSQLADYLRYGQYGVLKDIPAALKFLEQAAAKGDNESTLDAGMMLLEGDEVEADIPRAIQYLNTHHELTKSSVSKSLLVKAYLHAPALRPDQWDAEAMAISAARDNQLQGLAALVSAYREGKHGFSKNLQVAAKLAEVGLDVSVKAGMSTEAGWPMNAKGFAYTLMLAAEAGAHVLDAARAQVLAAEWGSTKGGMKRFTVPITCNLVKTSFNVYIWDPMGDVEPTVKQWKWIEQARGCVVSTEVKDSFRKLFQIARDNKVSFSDLAVYALAQAAKDTAQANSSQNAAGTGGAVSNTQSTVAQRPAALVTAAAGVPAPSSDHQTTAESKLISVLADIGRYERWKRHWISQNRKSGQLIDDLRELFDRLVLGKSNPSSAGWTDSCTEVRTLEQRRSNKLGEAAALWKLDLTCSGKTDAIVLVPDDLKRDATVYVQTRVSGADQLRAGGAEYGTRYIVDRALGVILSWHDLNGDGRYDSLGMHRAGAVEPYQTSPMTASAL